MLLKRLFCNNNNNVLAAGRMLLLQRSFGQTQALQQTIKNHEPNSLEKRFLVWSGKYKSVTDIPDFVSQEEMERVRNKMRIRIANIMMGLTVIGCALAIYSGKQASKRGESVTKQNLEWHKEFNQAIGKEPVTK